MNSNGERAEKLLPQFDELPNSAYVSLEVVARLFGISNPTVWRWVKSGHLPNPVKLGPNSTRWAVGALRERLRNVQGGVGGREHNDPPHTDHPTRHLDRTCPACLKTPNVGVEPVTPATEER